MKGYDAIRAQIRALKAAGKTLGQVAELLGLSRQLCHYYSRPSPGENICPRCCRPFKPVRGQSHKNTTQTT